jgi:hypothetical protein
MANVALITMALLPLLMCRRLCCCQADTIALIACRQASVIALVVLVLLPSMRLHLCGHCNCDCYPHDNGGITVVNAQASMALLSWYPHPQNNGIIPPHLQWCCCPLCNCIVTILKLATLPLLQLHC